MVKSKHGPRTIDEIIEFILVNDGPDLERRAHPKMQVVRYDDLEFALSEIHRRGILLNLRPFHFKNVRNIWTHDGERNYVLAREMTGLLMEELLERYGNYIEIIKKISFHQFHEYELAYNKRHSTIRFNLGPMLHLVYETSPSAAVIDFFKHHPNSEVKEEFKELKPCHFPMTPPGYWKSPEGQKDARQLIGQGLTEIFERSGRNWIELIKNVRDEYFENREVSFENKFGRIPIKLKSVIAGAYDGSYIQAVTDYLTNNDNDQDLRKEFAGLRPYHFVVSPLGTWVKSNGGLYAIELTDLVLKDIVQERDISLLQSIQAIRTTDFHRPLRFTNSYGYIEFSGSKAFGNDVMYNNSPTRAVLDWMTNNPDEKVRKEFSNFKLFYFSIVPDETYKGEKGLQIGREATEIVMDELLLEHGSYEAAVSHVQSDHFHKRRSYRNSFGEISYTLDNMFNGVYGRSSAKAVIDYVTHHKDESIRKRFALLQPNHFVGTPADRFEKIKRDLPRI